MDKTYSEEIQYLCAIGFTFLRAQWFIEMRDRYERGDFDGEKQPA